jgi:hypothetical protein
MLYTKEYVNQRLRGTEIGGLSGAWKELEKLRGRFFEKLMGVVNSARGGAVG